MIRHVALQPLSRFHRSILFLALVTKEGGPPVRGYPTEHDQLVDFAIQFYEERLRPHFDHEERELFEKVKNCSPVVAELIDHLVAEREEVAILFEKLSEDRQKETLNAIGSLLERHVRLEERQLFQQVQEACSEVLLRSLQC